MSKLQRNDYLQPIGDNLVILLDDKTKQRKIGNLHLPESATAQKGSKQGRIVSIGSLVRDTDTLRPGIIAILPLHSGTVIEVEKKVFVVVSEGDIRAVVKTKAEEVFETPS